MVLYSNGFLTSDSSDRSKRIWDATIGMLKTHNSTQKSIFISSARSTHNHNIPCTRYRFLSRKSAPTIASPLAKPLGVGRQPFAFIFNFS